MYLVLLIVPTYFKPTSLFEENQFSPVIFLLPLDHLRTRLSTFVPTDVQDLEYLEGRSTQNHYKNNEFCYQLQPYFLSHISQACLSYTYIRYLNLPLKATSINRHVFAASVVFLGVFSKLIEELRSGCNGIFLLSIFS